MKRHYSNKKTLHVVLRSRYATLRFKKNKTVISELLNEMSQKFGVKIYQNSLNSNHIHLLLMAKKREDLQAFLRVFSGQVAQRLTGAVRGRKLNVSFWANIAWSRVVEWGRAFNYVVSYIYQNQMETLGLSEYRTRGSPPGMGRLSSREALQTSRASGLD